MPIVGGFEGDDGNDGVMIGLPDRAYHLEITRQVNGSPCPIPTRDNLLVFYLPERAAVGKIVERLTGMGYHRVEPENPYWRDDGITIADPYDDGGHFFEHAGPADGGIAIQLQPAVVAAQLDRLEAEQADDGG